MTTWGIGRVWEKYLGCLFTELRHGRVAVVEGTDAAARKASLVRCREADRILLRPDKLHRELARRWYLPADDHLSASIQCSPLFVEPVSDGWQLKLSRWNEVYGRWQGGIGRFLHVPV